MISWSEEITMLTVQVLGGYRGKLLPLRHPAAICQSFNVGLVAVDH